MSLTPSSPKSSFTDANGQRIHFRQWSFEGPPLLFLHGVTSSTVSWEQVAPEFTRDFAVMALDLRGHGQSSKPESGYTWADHYGPDVTAFVKSQLDEPAILVGHSLGAMLTVPVAVEAREEVRAIVMEDPPAFTGEDPERRRDRFGPVLDLKRLPYDERLETFVKQHGYNESLAAQRADELEQLSEGVLTELIEGNTAFPPEEWFPNVECPSLVILGNPDRGGAVKMEHRSRLRQLLKSMRLVEWDDVGHNIHILRPQQFVEEVRGFLNQLPES